jgi:hypothetical protein
MLLHCSNMISQMRKAHGSHAVADYLICAKQLSLMSSCREADATRRIIKMASTKGKRGYIRKAVDAMIAGRTRQATRYANGALLRLDTETLRTLGYEKSELRKRGSAYHPL